MRLQLFREHLDSELDLPQTSSQGVQSRAVTTAVLLRYLVARLNIEGITVPDGDGGRPHDLKPLLNSFIHYERFYLDWPRDEVARRVVTLKSGRGREYRVSLDDYFGVVDRFAHDDVFIARALLRCVVTMLHRFENDSEASTDEDFIHTLGGLMMDAMELLHRMHAESRLDIPDSEMDGWLAETVEVTGGGWGSTMSPTTERFRDLVARYSTVFPNEIRPVRWEERACLEYLHEFSRRPRDSFIFTVGAWLGGLQAVRSALYSPPTSQASAVKPQT